MYVRELKSKNVGIRRDGTAQLTMRVYYKIPTKPGKPWLNGCNVFEHAMAGRDRLNDLREWVNGVRKS
jgi:hypothetical protein